MASSCAPTSSVKFVEVWAHSRPYFTSHQLHFDTAREGLGLRPVCSTVAYLTKAGGPTLVTQQMRPEGAVKGGFLVEPEEGRVSCFDGRLLHGVLPGGREEGGERVTLMCAFWKEVRRVGRCLCVVLC